MIYQCFPDAKFVMHDVFSTTERVVTRWTWTSTLTGAPILGIEAKGQKIGFAVIEVIDVRSVRDGQLQERWDQFDWPRALIQVRVTGLPQLFVDVAAKPVAR